jgi:hypothetical protein
MKLKQKLQQWGNYWMYYIDYFLSTLYNLIKVWFLLTLILLFLWIPPLLWKVHAFMWSILQNKSLFESMIEMKFAQCPVQKDEQDE